MNRLSNPNKKTVLLVVKVAVVLIGLEVILSYGYHAYRSPHSQNDMARQRSISVADKGEIRDDAEPKTGTYADSADNNVSPHDAFSRENISQTRVQDNDTPRESERPPKETPPTVSSDSPAAAVYGGIP